MWEITFYGFSEEEVQETREEMINSVKSVKEELNAKERF
jgi:hypothetical protein